MKGLCITDAAKKFGVTSKTLRYYERVGLLEAKRTDGGSNYRFFDVPEVERIEQILVLRKMQISIKDIIRRISQLAETQKNKLKEGELTVVTKQSNNIIPVIHRLVTDEYGENYWFNGCARYVMECLGEPDYDYWFFAGITGDIFTQHYAYAKSYWDAIDGYLFEEDPRQFVKDIFAKCGYAATYVAKEEVLENTEMYLQTLITYIDKGIPVINWDGPCGVFVGYEEYGKILLYVTGNNNQPERITLDDAARGQGGWIFAGEKRESRPLAGIYREAIQAIPGYFGVNREKRGKIAAKLRECAACADEILRVLKTHA